MMQVGTKMQNLFLRVVSILFGLLMAAILVATLLVDKNSENPFANVAKWSNGGYYLFAFAGLALLVWVWLRLRKRQAGLSERRFYILIGCIAGVTLILQAFISAWVPEMGGGDFVNVRDMAIHLSQGGSFASSSYFADYPNNVNITILLSWVWRITQSYGGMVFAGSLMANLSVVLMTLAVYRLSRNKFASLAMCLVGECLIALTWRAYLPYTDCWGMPFAIGMVVLYLSKTRREIKLPGILLLGMIGAWIKITVLIPLLAILIYSLLKMAIPVVGNLRERIRNKAQMERNVRSQTNAVRKILSYALCFVVVAGCWWGESVLKAHYGYEDSENAKSWKYFFLMGQNNDYYGQVGSPEFAAIYNGINARYPSREERNQVYFNTAVSLIAERGFTGNIKYYLKKINAAYNDGYFNNIQSYNAETVSKGLWYDIYCYNGKYYENGADILQIAWAFVLILLAAAGLFAILRKEKRDHYALFALMILGITLYLMIFENRSKYLYMFLPLYLTLAGAALACVLGKAETVRAALRAYRLSDDS